MRQSIGRYAVTGTLGEGGMGVVYAAHDERLGRPLAIKMIRGAADPDARERLYREARAAARVNHPAICQLYEIGEDGDELFLAMELLQGESLAARLARGPMPVHEAASTALGILTGVDALHRQALVHRDLKPTNIFLTPHGIKLLDFGLTCAVVPPETDDTSEIRLTAPGMVLGTPQYAAPEQLRGQMIDARSDLFAAGVVLYEMLAGRPPFTGRSPVEVFHSIMYEEPPVLTGGPVVTNLDQVVHKALAKRPDDRYASADAMAQGIRGALASSDTGSTAVTRAVTRLIVLPFRSLRPDPDTDFLAFGLADAITSALTGLQALVVRSSLAASRFASESPDLAVIAATAQVDAVLVGTLLRAGNQLRVSTQLVGLPAATVLWSQTTQVPIGDLFGLQDEVTGKIVESLSLPLTAHERQMLKHDVPLTPQVYERYLRANEMSRDSAQWWGALDLYEQCVAEDPGYAPAWAGVGRMHRMIGKYVDEEYHDRLARAEVALRRALELNPGLSPAENVYAHLQVDLGRAEEAMVRLVRRARERPADPDLYAGLVHACRYCGLLQPSLVAAERARRLDPRIRTSGAHTHFMLGDYEGVLDFQAESVPYMRNLALVMLGRHEEALRSLDQIEPNLTSLMHFTRALRHLILNEVSESIEALQPVVTIPDPEGRYYFARHLAYLGEHAQALSMLDDVVDGGFFCLPAFTRDPWLDGIRGTLEFAAVVRKAEARHKQALISFLTADGDRVLGSAQAV
jgi:serine/threonine protein kinase/tetratricopeptide (TPR) repeat protein